MRTLICKFFVLAGIILGALYILSSFNKPYLHYLNTISGFNALVDEEKSIDVAFYGSSHAYCSYNPRVIDSLLKVRSYNFGNESQRLVVSKYVLKETLKHINPKLVVLDVFPDSIADPEGQKDLSLQEKNYSYFNLSYTKINSAFEVFPLEQAIGVIFPALKRKDYWYTPKWNQNERYIYPTRARANPYRGFVGFDLVPKRDLKLSGQAKKELKIKVAEKCSEYYKLTRNEVGYIEEFIRIAKSNETEVLVVVAPYYSAFDPNIEYSGFHNFMKDFCNQKNIGFLDLNLMWDELRLTTNDFMDASHLNLDGANKISKYLAGYIEEHYTIPSRAYDSVWIAEQPKNLNSYLLNGYANDSKLVGEEMTGDVQIQAFGISDIEESRKVIIKLTNNLTDSVLKKYKFGLHTFAHDRDVNQLMPYSKSKNRTFDAWDFNPQITEVNGDKYVIKTINTSINSFTRVKMFLYDRSGYKGVKGKTIEIENVKVKQ